MWLWLWGPRLRLWLGLLVLSASAAVSSVFLLPHMGAAIGSSLRLPMRLVVAVLPFAAVRSLAAVLLLAAVLRLAAVRLLGSLPGPAAASIWLVRALLRVSAPHRIAADAWHAGVGARQA